jgi:hypothetical protein
VELILPQAFNEIVNTYEMSISTIFNRFLHPSLEPLLILFTMVATRRSISGDVHPGLVDLPQTRRTPAQVTADKKAKADRKVQETANKVVTHATLVARIAELELAQVTRQLEEDNGTSLTTSYKKKVACSYEGVDIMSQAEPEVGSSNLKDTGMEDDDGDDSAMNLEVDGIVLHANIDKQLVCIVFLQKKIDIHTSQSVLR